LILIAIILLCFLIVIKVNSHLSLQDLVLAFYPVKYSSPARKILRAAQAAKIISLSTMQSYEIYRITPNNSCQNFGKSFKTLSYPEKR